MTPRIKINKVFDVIAKAGGDLKISNIARHTPLGLAARRLSLEAAIAFLRHGASTITGDTQGLTTLHYAAAKAGAEGGAVRLVDRLLRWGVDEAAISFTGHTASCIVGFRTPVEEQVGEDVERVRKLLLKAAATRQAWARRGLFVLGRSRPELLKLVIRDSNDVSHRQEFEGTGWFDVAARVLEL